MNNGTFSNDNNGTNGAYNFSAGIDSLTTNTGSGWKPKPNPRHTTANVAGKLYEGNVHDKIKQMNKRGELM